MKRSKKEHIGFNGLVNHAMKFYEAKGYTHDEAMDIARKIAAHQNNMYVHHFGKRGKRDY